jgi:DNA (cytosine-5)-methyltransferase 1
MRTVAFCEQDEFCRAVLAKHWPAVPIIRDIKHLGPAEVERLGRIDVVCGGFPCQPFSVAGKQKGKEDDRHLWPYMQRVIAYARPAWVIGENVAGLIPMALDEVLLDLEKLGYTTRTFVVPACAVDAPHRRDRIWIVARDSNSESKPTGTVDDGEVAKLCGTATDTASDGWKQGRTSTGEGLRELGGVCDQRRDVANTNGESLGRPTESREERCEWVTEPDVGRVAHGVPRRVDRLRSLGNAVVPQVVEEIGRAIMKATHV